MKALGSIVTDTATGNDGMVTHLQIEMGGARFYSFQPRGLNPETGSPVESTWVVPDRLTGGDDEPEPELPLNVLGTLVTDEASGFSGIATGICLHISGCVHVTVQPRGKLTKTGAAPRSESFDIRRLVGDSIKRMTKQQRAADQAARPSPVFVAPYRPTMPR